MRMPPNATFSVLVDGDGFGIGQAGAFTTNNGGHGSWSFDNFASAAGPPGVPAR